MKKDLKTNTQKMQQTNKSTSVLDKFPTSIFDVTWGMTPEEVIETLDEKHDIELVCRSNAYSDGGCSQSVPIEDFSLDIYADGIEPIKAIPIEWVELGIFKGGQYKEKPISSLGLGFAEDKLFDVMISLEDQPSKELAVNVFEEVVTSLESEFGSPDVQKEHVKMWTFDMRNGLTACTIRISIKETSPTLFYCQIAFRNGNYILDNQKIDVDSNEFDVTDDE